MTTFMHCFACYYDLRCAPSATCPGCGRPFDPDDTRTYSRRRRPSLLVGLLFPITLTAIAFPALGFAFKINYVSERHLAFRMILGIGLPLGMTTSIMAALNRFLLVRILMLFVGILSVWAGLFLASDKFYRVWQASPNASSEAQADTGPIGALLAGWVPGTVFVGIIYVLAISTICFFG